MSATSVKSLPGLRWQRAWTAHMGCLKSCLDYLGVAISRPWLYGGTGHAFVLNVHEALCPSGPTAWNTSMLFRLAPNLGYRPHGMAVWRGEAGEGFGEKQREAFDLVRAAIDRGLPCYGWQMEAPDYYLITGYDDVGYYYAGEECEEGRGPLPWEKLATWDVDLLEVYRVEPVPPAPDEKTVSGALAFALKHALQPAEWIKPAYRSGPAGFGLWAEALEAGDASRDGCAYNAAVWHECREMAVEFLAEARTRLPGRCDHLFDQAAGHYAVVRDRLAELAQLVPMRPGWDDVGKLTSPDGAVLMRQAADAERQGLACLERIVAALA
jgi:hypothetical protein